MGQKNTERKIGYGLLNFVFWVPVQTILIIFQEQLGLLPSRIARLLGWAAVYPDMHYFRMFGDYYTMICAVVGCAYTAVGCILLSEYSLNTSKWWKGFWLWYIVYVVLTAFLTVGIGSLILDVWLAPIVWLGELELVHWIQNCIANKNRTKGVAI